MADTQGRREPEQELNKERNQGQSPEPDAAGFAQAGVWKAAFRKNGPTMFMVILTVAIILIIFFMILRFDGLSSGIGKAARTLQGVFFGFVIAYLINPIMKFFERRMLRFHKKRKGKSPDFPLRKRIRAVSSLIAIAILIAVVAGLIVLVVPYLIEAVRDLITNLNAESEYLLNLLLKLEEFNPQLAAWVENLMDNAADYLLAWIEEKMSSQGELIETITSSIYSVLVVFVNLIIGLVVAFYILMRKETFKGLVKKIVYAIFKPRAGNLVMDVLRKTDDVFGGFFVGDIIDSVIVGIVTFVAMLIIGLPYAALIALIVGVTNLIPMFGPYIGGIPSAILIFLVSPIQALYFIILIVVIQQIDGNILKPRILGDSIGLNAFWIIVAVLLFGGLFGITGFLVGVPIFAVIYYIIKRLLEFVLKRKELPHTTSDMIRVDHVDEQTKQAVLHDEEDMESFLIYPEYKGSGSQNLSRMIRGKRRKK